MGTCSKMRLPKHLSISGYTLNIIYKKKVVVDGDECFGVYDTSDKTIYLVKGMAPIRKKEIFLHEFIHFLEDIYRLDIQEECVSGIAMGILQLMTNPKLKWHVPQ